MTAPTSPKRRHLTLGPGTLAFGETGTDLDISCQVTAASVSAEGDSEDATPTLCGGTVAGERSYAWTLSYTAYQDVLANGIIDWTWKNAGREVPFNFTPDDSGAAVNGVVIVDPVTIGGTVRQKNTSESEWSIVGTPEFTPEAETDPAG